LFEQRSPFLYSFDSPYDQEKTSSVVIDAICETYARDIEGKPYPDRQTRIGALQDGVPLTISPYFSSMTSNQLVVSYGSQAGQFWKVIIDLTSNGSGTHGEVNLDRKKKDVDYLYYGEVMRLHQMLNKLLGEHPGGAGFKTVKWSSTIR
jgi:hypothetical protein